MTRWSGNGSPRLGRQSKKSPPPRRVDCLPGRKRHLGTTSGAQDLGTKGRDADPDPCLQLEEDVDLCGARLSIGWPSCPPLLPNAAGKLRRRESDRFPEGSQAPF